MPRIHTTVVCDEKELDRRRTVRDDLLVGERAPERDQGSDTGEITLELGSGPFSHYERRLRWRPTDTEGEYSLEQDISFRLAIPYWSRLFQPLVRRALPDGLPPGVTPWWLTPNRLSASQSTMVAAMALFNLVAGLLFGLLTQVLTFASADLGNGSADEQATIFAVARVGVVLTMVAMLFADKVGRRRIALWCFAAAGVLTVAAAASPTLWVLAGLQLVSRNLAIAGLLCVDTIAVEELPPGSRAMVTGLGALAYGLGAGFIVVALPLADLGPWGWRLTFLVAGVTLPMIWHASRHLPESARFQRLAASPVPDAANPPERRRIRGGRFVLIATMFFLFNLFVAPSSQLQNDYLRAEMGYTGLLIAVFTIATGAPAGLGVLAGGRLADIRGRRAAIIPGLLAIGAFTALFYSVGGSLMWIAALLAGVLGTLAVPAMGVIAPELFPTAHRGGVRGAITAIAVVGSVCGLLAAGSLVESQGYGTAFLVLAIAPLLAAGLALAIPETRGRELEDLNR